MKFLSAALWAFGLFLRFSSCDSQNRGCSVTAPWKCGPPEGYTFANFFFPRAERGNLRDMEFRDPDPKIPESFDARRKWPKCKSIARIINQGPCNTSWATTAASVMTDRLCIWTEGKDKFEFSSHEIITCCDYCVIGDFANPCDNTGQAVFALGYLMARGTVAERCQPYNPTALTRAPCKGECTDPNIRFDKNRHRIHHLEMETGETRRIDLSQIQLQIMTQGPIISLMTVNEHFYEHGGKGGVYRAPWKDNRTIEHHVKIIGWGTEQGTPYWLVVNSWGKAWGDLGGVFKIRRGSDELRIEKYMFAGSFQKVAKVTSVAGPTQIGTPGIYLIICLIIGFNVCTS